MYIKRSIPTQVKQMRFIFYRLIDCQLVDLMEKEETDLIIIEGMGRAVHTNFNACFSCEALKIAVIKNRWLANRLGGDMFSVMFKYEAPRRIYASTSWCHRMNCYSIYMYCQCRFLNHCILQLCLPQAKCMNSLPNNRPNTTQFYILMHKLKNVWNTG